jgi:hypothetical protein
MNNLSTITLAAVHVSASVDRMGSPAMRSNKSCHPAASEQVQNERYDSQKYQYVNKSARYMKG